jgi:glucitol operon activator protein
MAILWLALFLMMALQIGLGAIQTRACRRDLAAMRELGLAADAREFRFARRRHPYDAAAVSAKKGALIQAVEAIERRLAAEADAAGTAGADREPSLHARALAKARLRAR